MEKNSTKRNESGVQVISRVANILRALKGHPQGLGLSQLAREVGLPRSTAHRICAALEVERFVTSATPNGRIRLGSGLAPLAAAVNTDLRRELRPFLEGLHMEVNETVDLALLDENEVFFVDQIAAPQRLQAVSAVGVTFPTYCTANGKALLAELPDEEVMRLVPEQLLQLTPNTLGSRAQLLMELEQVRKDGVAFDREEHTVGICAVGVTVRDHLEELAAITIPVPSIRFYGNELKFAQALRNTRDQINHRLTGSR